MLNRLLAAIVRLFLTDADRLEIVLGCIDHGVVEGRKIKRVLKMGGPSFYQMMARFEKQGHVEGYWGHEWIKAAGESRHIRTRCYTRKGRAPYNG
jgi:hypothetical protein